MEYYTTAQVAERLSVSIDTVQRWIRGGYLGAARLTKRSGYRVNSADLEAFYQSRKKEREEKTSCPES